MLRRIFWLPAIVPNLYGIIFFVPYLLWGHRLRWDGEVWRFERKPGSFLDRKWRWSTTLGHTILFRPDPSDVIIRHEKKHVEQFDSQALLGLILFLELLYLKHPVWALLNWFAMPALSYLCAGVIAWSRGESFYFGNHLEEAAYSTALSPDQKVSCRDEQAVGQAIAVNTTHSQR
jgi:hypothetical protein